jgi:nucleotide-binding universal stress UspA family protein
MFNKILVAVDGSPNSLQALDYAVHLATQDKAQLTIISAAEPLPPLTFDAGEPPTYYPHYQETLHQALEKMQQEQLAKLTKTHPPLKIQAKVIDGRPATVIREAAKDTDLIVIGHRGKGGIISWMLGSVAKQIVDTCTAPVLIIKDKDYCPT